jgi:hypothetical protein
MIDDRRLLVAVTAVALAGVLGLFAYSTTLEPAMLEIGEIDESRIGEVVRTQGTVTRAREVAGGSVSATIADLETSASIVVFIPAGGEPLLPGAVIEVQGEVLLYNEELEISVAKPEDVRVMMNANSYDFDLPTLMGSIEMFDGAELTTRGAVMGMEVIYSNGTLVGTSFSLLNETGNSTYCLSCMCFDRDLSSTVAEWDSVRVTGEISFYENRACWQLVVEAVAASDA